MLKTRWETIRDDVAEMLADGVPLEDITGKLEKLKNEYQEPLTNEEWFCQLSTEEKAKWMFRLTYKCYWCGREYEKTKKYNEKECPFQKCLDDSKGFKKWLKEKHE